MAEYCKEKVYWDIELTLIRLKFFLFNRKLIKKVTLANLKL